MRTREEIKTLYDTMLDEFNATGKVPAGLHFESEELDMFLDIMHEKQREVCRPILEGLAQKEKWEMFARFAKTRPDLLEDALAYDVPEPYRTEIVAAAEIEE